MAKMDSADISIPVCGMVKDDKHTTRGLVFGGVEYDLRETPALFRFISAIQNEAHRFAIEYNRKKRGSRYFESGLDGIPGVGAARRDALLRHFGSVREIKAVSRDQLESVKGISATIADNIYRHFHGKD
jgi:excinuclease ABC subunit C